MKRITSMEETRKILMSCRNVAVMKYIEHGEDKNGVKQATPCFITTAGFYDTVEGCTLANCGESICKKATDLFYTFSPETRHQLAFSPKEGEYAARLHFWRTRLRPVLTKDEYRIAMYSLLDWFRHIKFDIRGQDDTINNTIGEVA
ncbi:MAG: hypothetical protein LUE14_09580 [Clostridiales bacterium]|nr:hypothetical protein [Clostridiales bacterium]